MIQIIEGETSTKWSWSLSLKNAYRAWGTVEGVPEILERKVFESFIRDLGASLVTQMEIRVDGQRVSFDGPLAWSLQESEVISSNWVVLNGSSILMEGEWSHEGQSASMDLRWLGEPVSSIMNLYIQVGHVQKSLDWSLDGRVRSWEFPKAPDLPSPVFPLLSSRLWKWLGLMLFCVIIFLWMCHKTRGNKIRRLTVFAVLSAVGVGIWTDRSHSMIEGLPTEAEWRSWLMFRIQDTYQRYPHQSLDDFLRETSRYYSGDALKRLVLELGEGKLLESDKELVSVTNVWVESVDMKWSLDDKAWSGDIEWEVEGVVQHFSHLHRKKLRHRSSIEILWRNGRWMISSFLPLSQEICRSSR